MKYLVLLFFLVLTLSGDAQDRILESSKAYIHPFKTIDAEELKSFVKTIAKDKSIIGLGEVSHYTKECYELKHQIIATLMEQGFDGLVLEVDYGQALLWNDYVLHGRGNLDTLIASSAWFTYRTEEFKNLLRDIRKHNLSGKIPFQIYGMEMTAVFNNIDWLKKYIRSSGIEAEELLLQLSTERKSVAFQSYNETAIKDYWDLYYSSNRFLQKQKSYLLGKDSMAFSNALQIVEIFRQFATYISQDEFYLQVELRDLFSTRNVMWALGSQNENRQLVLWAHNGHVTKESVVSNYDVLGHYLQQRLGDQYYAIGFTFNEGSFGSFGPDGFGKWTLPRATNISFTTAFAAFESPYFVFDIRKNLKNDRDTQSLLRKPFRIRTDISESYNPNQATLMEINLSKAYDALIYIEKTSFPTTIDWIR